MNLPGVLIANPHDDMEVTQECTIRDVFAKVDFTQPIGRYLEKASYESQIPPGFPPTALCPHGSGVKMMWCRLFLFKNDPCTEEIDEMMKRNNCIPGGAHEAIGVVVTDAIARGYYALVARGVTRKSNAKEYAFALTKRNGTPHVESLGARQQDGRWSAKYVFLGVPIST